MTTEQETQVSEAQIAVHWREEKYYHPLATFIAQANAADPAFFERFSERHFPGAWANFAPSTEDVLGFSGDMFHSTHAHAADAGTAEGSKHNTASKARIICSPLRSWSSLQCRLLRRAPGRHRLLATIRSLRRSKLGSRKVAVRPLKRPAK